MRLNPWMSALLLTAVIAAFVGLVMISSPSPTTAATGHALLTIGGVALVGLLAAGAITWQMRR